MGEPALKVIAVDGACGRDDASPRVLIGDVLYDCRALADHLPVVELEQRNLALWVDLPIIVALLGLFLAQIDLLQVELGPRLPQDDVGRERTRAGRKIQLHDFLLVAGNEPAAGENAPPEPGAQAVLIVTMSISGIARFVRERSLARR